MPPHIWSSVSYALDEDLLFLLQGSCNIHGYFEYSRHYVRGCKSQPLCQGNISDSVALVYLNPGQVIIRGGVLDIVTYA